MKCPQCDKEMQKGSVSFMSVQGLGQMIISFTDDDEKENGFFKRKTKDKIVCSGEERVAYYCADCNKMMPIIELK